MISSNAFYARRALIQRILTNSTHARANSIFSAEMTSLLARIDNITRDRLDGNVSTIVPTCYGNTSPSRNSDLRHGDSCAVSSSIGGGLGVVKGAVIGFDVSGGVDGGGAAGAAGAGVGAEDEPGDSGEDEEYENNRRPSRRKSSPSWAIQVQITLEI